MLQKSQGEIADVKVHVEVPKGQVTFTTYDLAGGVSTITVTPDFTLDITIKGPLRILMADGVEWLLKPRSGNIELHQERHA